MQKIVFFILFVFSSFSFSAQQFVSLNLCSDRLLMEFARPEQIAAMSVYSKKSEMMLDKVNHDKPVIQPTILEMLPYLNSTVLINERFYPQLSEQLKQLGVKTFPLNQEPETLEALFELMLQIGELVGNRDYAEQRVRSLSSQSYALNLDATQTLFLSETGMVESYQSHYRALLSLLNLSPTTLSHFSFESLLLNPPDVLIKLTDQRAYSAQGEILTHPAIQRLYHNRPHARIPMNYTYCFDHGIWQAAEQIFLQLQPHSK